MKLSIVLYALPFLLQSATPAPLPTTELGLHDNDHTPALVLIPTSTLQRRMKGSKRNKSDDEKKDDAKKVLQAPGGASSVRKTKEQEAAEKKARVSDKKRRREEAVTAQKEKEANMSPEEKRKLEEERAAKKEQLRQEKEKREAEKNEAERNKVWISYSKVTEKDYENYWKFFAKGGGGRGLDQKGEADEDSMAKKFQACVDKDKFMFWSGHNKAFKTAAVARYSKLSGRLALADAMKTRECSTGTNALASDINRPSVGTYFKKWIIDERENGGKGKGSAKKYDLSKAHEALMKKKLNDQYWAMASRAWAKGAHGEIVYLRPERNAGDNTFISFPNTYWADQERPALASNRKVTKAYEVTFPKYNSEQEYGNLPEPQKKEFRLVDGAFGGKRN